MFVVGFLLGTFDAVQQQSAVSGVNQGVNALAEHAGTSGEITRHEFHDGNAKIGTDGAVDGKF